MFEIAMGDKVDVDGRVENLVVVSTVMQFLQCDLQQTTRRYWAEPDWLMASVQPRFVYEHNA